MAETTYDPSTPASGLDIATRVNGPAVAPSPRGLLSVASVVEDPGPSRWAVQGALYESVAGFPASGDGHGIIKMNPTVPCPSPAAGTTGGLTLARATSYLAWTRISCLGPNTPAESYATEKYAAVEERLMESILADIVGETTPASLGTNAGAALATLEASFSAVWAGQGTVWADLSTIYALGAASALIEQGNALYTLSGHRVSVSPVYTVDLAITPNLSVLRTPPDMLDLFDRATNLNDALMQREYLFLIDPDTDVVSGNLA